MDYSDYILLDAARLDGFIYQAQELNENYRCLYEGDSEAVLGAVGPWLFQLDLYSEFIDFVVEHGAGNSWGIIIRSNAEEEDLYRHLRQFLIVHKEDGKELYFRFYDPRVLREFLPTCDSEQLIEFFGPVTTYIMEDEEGQMIQFRLIEGKLQRDDLNIDLETYMHSTEDHDIETTGTVIEPVEKKDKEERWNFGL